MKIKTRIHDTLIGLLLAIIIRLCLLPLTGLFETILYNILGIVIIAYSTNLGNWRTRRITEAKEDLMKREMEELFANIISMNMLTGKWSIWIFRVLGFAILGLSVYRFWIL
jgi:hypothetical protein